MKTISRFWKLPAFALVGWGGFITFAMVLNFITGNNIEEGEHGEMLMLTLFMAVLPLIVGILLLIKLKKDYNYLDSQRTQKNLLILAKQSGGNITLSDAMIKLNLSQEKARSLLDNQVYQGLATFEIKEDGNTYYDFKDYN